MLNKLRMNDVVQAQHESSTTQDLISPDHSSLSHFALTPYSVVGMTVIAIAILVLFSWIGEVSQHPTRTITQQQKDPLLTSPLSSLFIVVCTMEIWFSKSKR